MINAVAVFMPAPRPTPKPSDVGVLADIGGVPHYFWALNDYARPGDRDDEHFVWPAGQTALAWECEQWAIFVEWNARYEAGTATPGSHPCHGGVNIGYDELTRLLQPHRMMPRCARRMKVEWRWDAPSTRPRYTPRALATAPAGAPRSEAASTLACMASTSDSVFADSHWEDPTRRAWYIAVLLVPAAVGDRLTPVERALPYRRMALAPAVLASM